MATRGRSLTFVIAAILMCSCGSTQPTTRSAAKPPPQPTAEAAPAQPAFAGPWHAMREEFEIKGFEAAGVRGADVVIYLKRTSWSEIDMGTTTIREGYALVEVSSKDGKQELRIPVDENRVVGAVNIAVTFVGDAVDDRTGRDIPHAKFIVTAAR